MIPLRVVHTAVLSQGRYSIQGWNAWALIESAYEFRQLLLTRWGRSPGNTALYVVCTGTMYQEAATDQLYRTQTT